MVYVKSNQYLDLLLMELKESVVMKNNQTFSHESDGEHIYQWRLYVPDMDGLSEQFFDEALDSRYSISLKAIKFYRAFCYM